MINSVLGFAIQILWFIAPYAATIALGYFAWILWRHYVQQNFIAGIDWVLLEVVPPRDVLRSPKGMELFFTNALFHLSMKGFFEKYWIGAVWFWFSLEIASFDGQVHFYIRVPSRVKELVETQMYAQYPQAQIKVAEDYTFGVDRITPNSEWNLWGCEFGLLKHNAYPIKTYVDFGLDKDPKEEYKVDPISPVIELFGSIKKDEQMWVQIVLTASQPVNHRKSRRNTGDWINDAESELFRIATPYTKIEKREDGTVLKTGRTPDFLKPHIDGINRKVQKLGFDCGIRTCYVAKKEVFREDMRRDIRLIFRQYASPLLNGFDRINSTQFDSPWEFTNTSLLKLKDRALEQYRQRSFFYVPIRQKIPIPWPISLLIPQYRKHNIIVLNTEELATIWHFPGQTLKVPTLERIESKEAAPPTNLPL